MNKKYSSKLKANIDSSMERMEKLVKQYFGDLLDRDFIEQNVTKLFNEGLQVGEVQFGLNFVKNPVKINFLTDYTFDLVKGMTDKIAKDVRQEISRAIMNLEDPNQIRLRIQKVMDESEIRARLIARTEMNRALNEGHLEAAQQSGLNLVKKWDAHLDMRTSHICRTLNNAVVPMDKNFIYTDKKGKKHEYKLPPAHPNCRSRVLYIQVDKKKNI